MKDILFFIKTKPWLFISIMVVMIFITSVTLLIKGFIPDNMGWFHFLYIGILILSMDRHIKSRKND